MYKNSRQNMGVVKFELNLNIKNYIKHHYLHKKLYIKNFNGKLNVISIIHLP